MLDLDFNLFFILDVLFVEGSVVGVVWCLCLSLLVMSCLLVWLCEVIGDLLLVCVGCGLVVLLWVLELCECIGLLV